MTHREIIWRPRPDDLEHSHVARLMRRHGIATAAELRRRAAAEPHWFYPALLQDLGVEWYRWYVDLVDGSQGLPYTHWFREGRLNVVHNVLDRHVLAGHGDAQAVIAEDDDGNIVTLTYGQLDERVQRFAAALQVLGVGVDDAVGFYLPMCADVVVALLACLRIGAVPVPVYAGFGPEALASRLVDAGAKVLLTADGMRRRGKFTPLKHAADVALQHAPSVRRVIVLDHADAPMPLTPGVDLLWAELEAAVPLGLNTVPLDASARALILHTSGTTGRPKGAVHTHGGVQVVTAKEHGYHLDVRPGDVAFWVTDIGWMVGPWAILGTLFHRGTIVLLEGYADHPGPERVWAMVERHRVTHLGLPPTVVRTLAAHGAGVPKRFDLSSLRILASTGEPSDDSSWRWFFENAGGGRCPVINVSGGTELMGCLLAPLPVEPLTPTTLQGPALGMDVDVVDDAGQSVRGEVGYLVCRNAAPNMSRGFLDDVERWLETYFKRFGPTMWFHGDWAVVDEDGFWYLTGRADDTLKIGGKRIAPGEVEAAAVAHPAVREAAAVGVFDAVTGMRLVLVAVPGPAFAPCSALGEDVAEHVAAQLGAAMRPSEVRWARALPMTRSGKILRGVIRKALAGEDVGSLAQCANPEAVEELRTS